MFFKKKEGSPMKVTLSHALPKSTEWLSMNPAASVTLTRYTMILKKISVQGYGLLMAYLEKLITHPSSLRTVETSSAVRKYMSMPNGIGQAADMIAKLFAYINQVREKFEQDVIEKIDSIAEKPVLLSLFDLLILYTHVHILPCES